MINNQMTIYRHRKFILKQIRLKLAEMDANENYIITRQKNTVATITKRRDRLENDE